MTSFNDFRKQRRTQLIEQHPSYSLRTIQSIISDEWKQQKGSGSPITSRKTTIQYEAIKTLINRTPQYDIKTSKEVCDIVNSKSCSYCNKTLNRKSMGDHFMPVAANTETPIISNFSSLTVPCCQGCNSSKGNKPWQKFVKLKQTSPESREKLQFLQDFINKHIEQFTVDKEEYEKLKRKIGAVLEDLRQDFENIPIIKVTNEQKINL